MPFRRLMIPVQLEIARTAAFASNLVRRPAVLAFAFCRHGVDECNLYPSLYWQKPCCFREACR